MEGAGFSCLNFEVLLWRQLVDIYVAGAQETGLHWKYRLGDQHLRDENQSHGREILGVLNHVFPLSCLRKGGIAGGWSILCKDFVYSAYKLLFVPVERCVCVCVCV